MKVVNNAKLVRIAGHLYRNAEDLATSTHAPRPDSCHIAGAMLLFPYSLVPLRVGTRFDC
jgi:hypothetical protein